MYISGVPTTFEQRLHSLCFDTGSLSSFSGEARCQYLNTGSGVFYGTIRKWERELEKKNLEIVRSGQHFLPTGYF